MKRIGKKEENQIQNCSKGPEFDRGMSLPELIIAIGILGLIMVAVYAFEANIFIYTNESGVQITNTWQAEAVLKPMTLELRTMMPSATGSYPILSVGTSTITFFINADNDASIERVRYFLSSSTLYRGQIDPSGSPPVYIQSNEKLKTLANGVLSSSTLSLFQYYDGSYEGTSSPLTYPLNISSIKLVRINVIIDTDPGRTPALKTFTSSVSLRNLKNNL